MSKLQVGSWIDPVVRYDTAEEMWYLAKDWAIRIGGELIVIAEGFRFDLASIPKPLWSVIGPMELSVSAALIHDWLYQHRGVVEAKALEFSRANADTIFRLVMKAEEVPALRRAASWFAVRFFGWLAWRK